MRVRGADGKTASGAPIEVKVIDNGPGVPASLRDHLFQPFVTTRARGTRRAGSALTSR